MQTKLILFLTYILHLLYPIFLNIYMLPKGFFSVPSCLVTWLFNSQDSSGAIPILAIPDHPCRSARTRLKSAYFVKVQPAAPDDRMTWTVFTGDLCSSNNFILSLKGLLKDSVVKDYIFDFFQNIFKEIYENLNIFSLN